MLEEKVAIITGGTRGIGYETVRLFLQNKAKVALFGSKEESVNKTITKLKEENPNYEVIGLHPTLHNEKEVKEAFEKVKNEFGKINILINNAGISSATKITDYTEEEIDNIININIKGVFTCSKVAIPYLEEQNGGSIINTSSMVSIHAQSTGCLYPTSKFAVNGLTKSLARELAPKNIRVNAVAPGITKTDMVAALPDKVIEPLIQSIPLKRIGEPIDIANAFLFLVSENATYITGEIMQVDGCARA